MLKHTLHQTPKILTLLGILFAMFFLDLYCDYYRKIDLSSPDLAAELIPVETPAPLSENSENEALAPNYTLLEEGVASHYGYAWNGRKTASGEVLDCSAYQGAHRTLPFGTIVRVSSVAEPEKSVLVKIIDRGPHVEGRVIDLTPSAFAELAPLSRGVVKVELEVETPATTN